MADLPRHREVCELSRHCHRAGSLRQLDAERFRILAAGAELDFVVVLKKQAVRDLSGILGSCQLQGGRVSLMPVLGWVDMDS